MSSHEQRQERCEARGAAYVAQDAPDVGDGCTGCAGRFDKDLCQALPQCMPQGRGDGRRVVFVKGDVK